MARLLMWCVRFRPGVAGVSAGAPGSVKARRALLSASDGDGPVGTLTGREREVLQLVAEGLSNQAIAERLDVTLRATQKHVSSIFEKLGLPATGSEHRRVLAVLRFLRA